MNKIERKITYGEFLTYQEKYPKTKAFFTASGVVPASEEFKLTANTIGRMTILLDEDVTYN
jgi:hypothetical protein